LPKALVVHPNLALWSGGEYVCLRICEALQNKGYEVSLASDTFDLDGGESIWKGREIMEKCDWIPLPKPRFNRARSLQRLLHVRELVGLDPDVAFNTQLSSYLMPEARTIDFAYHPGDLIYYWGNSLRSKRELYYSLIRTVRSIC
jgi:hypothetical protein